MDTCYTLRLPICLKIAFLANWLYPNLPLVDGLASRKFFDLSTGWVRIRASASRCSSSMPLLIEFGSIRDERVLKPSRYVYLAGESLAAGPLII